jgi:hypothetical protein
VHRSARKWWFWLVLAIGFCAVAIVAGPVADRHGYGTFVGLIASILAWIACAVCLVLGFVRFVKWIFATIRNRRTLLRG